jgi:hypothetical protein
VIIEPSCGRHFASGSPRPSIVGGTMAEGSKPVH